MINCTHFGLTEEQLGNCV